MCERKADTEKKLQATDTVCIKRWRLRKQQQQQLSRMGCIISNFLCPDYFICLLKYSDKRIEMRSHQTIGKKCNVAITDCY